MLILRPDLYKMVTENPARILVTMNDAKTAKLVIACVGSMGSVIAATTKNQSYTN